VHQIWALFPWSQKGCARSARGGAKLNILCSLVFGTSGKQLSRLGFKQLSGYSLFSVYREGVPKSESTESVAPTASMVLDGWKHSAETGPMRAPRKPSK
jgi:hypothetical protein